MSESLLEVRNLRKSYEGGHIQALEGVDLRVQAGDFVSISGPSGSGKSTLLNLLGGLDTPTSGDVLYKNRKLGGEVDLDTYRSQHVGFVFQAFYLLPSLSAVENVQVPWIGNKIGNKIGSSSSGHTRAEKAESLLSELGMGHRLHQYPGQLSAGERQRVAIARSLANDPEVLLADEPTGNLDSVNSAKIMEILVGLQAKRGMTLIIITHEDSIAESAPRHIRMRDGRIVQ
jgi:ABC-type lipoprotein export system ATPase subunit